MTVESDLHCRACGYRWDEPPWGEDGRLASFDLCPCCWVQVGFEDSSPAAARAYRARWLQKGAPWSTPDVPHDGLTTEQRLRRVPPGFEDDPADDHLVTEEDAAMQNLVSHFVKHSEQFPELSGAADYGEATRGFLADPPWGTRTGVRPNGDVVRFHRRSNRLAVMSSVGAPMTMLRPDKVGAKQYFLQLVGQAPGFEVLPGTDPHCRVCGYDAGHPQWAGDGCDPEFDICVCCFAETGVDDWTPDRARAYRAIWLSGGAPWAFSDVAHDGLTTQQRLAHLPPGFA